MSQLFARWLFFPRIPTPLSGFGTQHNNYLRKSADRKAQNISVALISLTVLIHALRSALFFQVAFITSSNLTHNLFFYFQKFLEKNLLTVLLCIWNTFEALFLSFSLPCVILAHFLLWSLTSHLSLSLSLHQSSLPLPFPIPSLLPLTVWTKF